MKAWGGCLRRGRQKTARSCARRRQGRRRRAAAAGARPGTPRRPVPSSANIKREPSYFLGSPFTVIGAIGGALHVLVRILNSCLHVTATVPQEC